MTYLYSNVVLGDLALLVMTVKGGVDYIFSEKEAHNLCCMLL